MRIEVTIGFKNLLSLPLHYNHILQGFIFNLMNKREIKDFYHNEGFAFENRRYKAFVFSQLFGKYIIESKQINFLSPCRFLFATTEQSLLASIIDYQNITRKLSILDKQIVIKNITLIPEINYNTVSKITALTPITAYSTDKNGYTTYYNCYSDEFKKIIKDNLYKKAFSILGKDLSKQEFDIKPAGNNIEKFIKYKEFLVKGWTGDFKINSTSDFLEIAFNCGLGAKNAQGFGFIQ